MKDIINVIFIATLLSLPQHVVADEADAILLTAHIPPYTFQDDNGNYIGIADKVIDTLFEKAGLTYEIKTRPWKRAINDYLKNTDMMIYPITRTREREQQYQWIIPLFSIDLKLYGLREKFENVSVDITSGRYSFVCIKTTINCSLLKGLDIPDNAITTINSINPGQMLRMLDYGHVDLLLLPEAEFRVISNKLNLPADRFIALKDHDYKLTDYLAAKVELDNEIIRKLKQTVASMDEHGVQNQKDH